MAEFIRIKGWGKYQHYKDRNPPWIKLHRELLTSLTWALADDASRVLAIACMLLAAATDNKIPFDPAYVKRVAYLNHDPDFSQLLKLEFLEVVDDKGHLAITAITPLAGASKMQAHARPETETETEQRKRQKKPSSRSASTDGVFLKAYAQYPRHVGKRAAQIAWTNAVNRVWGADESSDHAQAAEMVYQRVMTYAAVCERAGKEKQFIPHMATWLNQDRFMDDPSEWAVTENGGKGNGNGARQVSKADSRERRIIDNVVAYRTAAAGAASGASDGQMAVPRDGETGVCGLDGQPEIISPGKDSRRAKPFDGSPTET